MTGPKSLTILGATGSIGQSTLDLVKRNPDRFRVEALTAQCNVEALAEAAKETDAKLAVIGDQGRYDELKDALADTDIGVAAGPEAITEAATRPADITMAAIVGCAGLAPTMAAIERGGVVALANKEALVCAGELMTGRAKATGAALLPVDSEHNAIFQCFNPGQIGHVSRIILTSSGGPFRRASLDAMRAATPEQAIAHPNWSMGAKISVDSATMMNKGLELIEAHHLFPIGHEKIEILVHPQSMIHSMVEYDDGSVLAQLGSPDMRTPIAYCLAWPGRMEAPAKKLDFAAIGRFDFEAPDTARFPALRLARQVLEQGGARPATLNAANEVAVEAFLARKTGFLDIIAIVESVLDSYDPPAPQTIGDVFAVDGEARALARQHLESKVHC